MIYSWQVSSCEKSLVGEKKFIPIFPGFCRFRFPLHRFVFHFLWQMPAYLVGYANGMLHSEQPTVLLARRHLNTMLLTNFENLNFISNIFQETQDFLVLTEPLIICIYLRTTDRQFCDQRNVRLPDSKLLKYDLVQTLNTLNTLLCEFLLPGRHLFHLIFVGSPFFQNTKSSSQIWIKKSCGKISCPHGNCFKKIDYFWKSCFQILVFDNDKWNGFKQEKESFKKKYKRP